MNSIEDQSEKFLRASSENRNKRKSKSTCCNCNNAKFLTVFGILFVLIMILSIFAIFWLSTGNSIGLLEVNQTIGNSTFNQTMKNESGDPDKRTTKLHPKTGTLASQSRLIGHWKSIKSENFDKYMKAFGIDFFRRSFAAVAETSEIISKDGDVWSLFGQIHIKFPVKVISDIKFKEGEEFEYDATHGSRVKSKFVSDGPDKLIQEERELKTGKLIAVLIREINSHDQLVTTMTSGKFTAIKTYERVK